MKHLYKYCIQSPSIWTDCIFEFEGTEKQFIRHVKKELKQDYNSDYYIRAYRGDYTANIDLLSDNNSVDWF